MHDHMSHLQKKKFLFYYGLPWLAIADLDQSGRYHAKRLSWYLLGALLSVIIGGIAALEKSVHGG